MTPPLPAPTAPLLGVVADDLTGACDLATAVTEEGLGALVLLGVPDADLPADADAVVVALKSRTTPAHDAVRESVASARWLLERGAQRLYQKYCSTFDSTDRGNIGPVAEALALEISPDAVSVGTPATPRVGRAQYEGHLFVDGRPLAESPLRDHPLTPMRDSDLVRVLARQSTRPVGLVRHSIVRAGPAAVADELHRLGDAAVVHALVDAVSDDDLVVAAEALQLVGRPLLAGGAAGLARAMARSLADRASGSAEAPTVAEGRRIVLSGSGSARTREQVARFPGTVVTVDPLALAGGSGLDGLLGEVDRAAAADDGAVLVSATTEPERVRAVQAELGTAEAAGIVEEALAAVARHAVGSLGATRLIVAGGETSGAVAAALGVRVLRIAELAAPGVPWTVAERGDAPPLALLLKSGNFGGPDLFRDAWEVAP